MRHISDDERRARLVTRHGIAPATRLDDADAATRAMTALHATEPATVYLSLLARVDFSGGWPPAKQFDLQITFTTPDERLRPGMSAVARIGVGQIPDVLIVPGKAIFTDGGRPVVYRFTGRQFVAVPI